MPVKMTGAQFKAWMASDWGPDAMWEDYHYTVDDENVLTDTDDFDEMTIADSAIVHLSAGTIYTDQNDILKSPTISAVTHARKWLKAQNTVMLMVEVPREHAEWFATSIKGIGVNHEFAKIVGRVG